MFDGGDCDFDDTSALEKGHLVFLKCSFLLLF